MGAVPAVHHEPAASCARWSPTTPRRSRPTGPIPTSPATRAGRRRTRWRRRERLIADQAALDGPVAGDWIQIAVDARRRAGRRRRRRARRRRADRHARLHAGARLPGSRAGPGGRRRRRRPALRRRSACTASRPRSIPPTCRRPASSRTSASSTRASPCRPCATARRGSTTSATRSTVDARAAWAARPAAPARRRPPRRDHAGQRRGPCCACATHRSQRALRRRRWPSRSPMRCSRRWSTARRSCRGSGPSRPTASWPGS